MFLLLMLNSALAPSSAIMDNPCDALPPMPAVVREYLARAQSAEANGTVPAEPSAAGIAIYTEWQRELVLADFSGLCRYRASNRTLGAPTPDRIVFFGDSITENWKNARPGFFAGERINRGISGQTTAQMLGRFRADVIDLRPRAVHILAGTNDIAGNTGPTSYTAIENNLRAMVELAQANGIRVVIGSVLPAQRFDWRPGFEPAEAIKQLNIRLELLAQSEGAEFIDYYRALDDGAGGMTRENAKDGVHPTAVGYASMEVVASAALTQVLER